MKNVITRVSLLNIGVKAHYSGLFWKSQWQFFLNESNIVALYSNIFEKLGKRINVQFKVDFTKDGTSNVTVQTTPKKISL
jgi:hypothetical protein